MGTTLFAIGLFDCNINRDVFYVWITKILLPELPENAVIFMDNASFHKGKNIEQAIINAGHQIEYLPVYSPDLNPMNINGLKLNVKRWKQDALSMTCF